VDYRIEYYSEGLEEEILALPDSLTRSLLGTSF